MRNNMSKQAGFSLVELMVVVAIIGVLASVAIPSFSKFQRRARAVEGKTTLSSHYEAQKAFLAEWEGYSANLAAIGFSFEGQTRTELDINGDGTAAGDTALRYSTEAAAAWATVSATDFSTLIASGLCGHAVFSPACAVNVAGAGTPTYANAAFTLTTFEALVATEVGSGTAEEWTMNEQKLLTQRVDGINL